MLSYNTKETTLLKKCLTSDNESISKTIYLCNEDYYVLYISRYKKYVQYRNIECTTWCDTQNVT